MRGIPLAKQSLQMMPAGETGRLRPKPFRVSYYKIKEVDGRGFALLHAVRVWAETADEARRFAITKGKKLVCIYMDYGLAAPKKDGLRRIYVLSPDFTTPKNMKGGIYTRKYPLCRLLGCGKPNPKGWQYHSQACRRAARNEKQLRSKRERIRVATRNGIRVCKHCVVRPVGCFSNSECNKCFLRNRKMYMPKTLAAKQVLRLQAQLPRAVEALLVAPLHKCTISKYRGDRFPGCGCRLHILQWLVINAEKYVLLRRPLQSYRMSGQALPPWFQKTRPRRDFAAEKLAFRGGTMLAPAQSPMALAV